MGKDTKNSVDTGEKLKKDTKFKKGNDPRRNLAGRPLGSKNFETDFLQAVKKIADTNKITTAEAMEVLLRKAYTEGASGQFNFYKDIMDRLYGKVIEKTDITSGGEPLFKPSKEEQDKINQVFKSE